MNLRIIMMKEVRPKTKSTYSRICKLTYRDRKQIGGCLGKGSAWGGEEIKAHRGVRDNF